MNDTQTIRHVLVPHDFGAAADHALFLGLAIAEKFGARLTVLHTYEVPNLGYPDAFVAAFELATEIERAAAGELERLAAREELAAAKVETVLRRGTPWVEIVEACGRLSADLVVMGTHGRKAVSRLLLGSVAEKVVRSARCPVLTVHAPELPARP
jgi:nucleotide-binding universal stress UspA family protein